MEHADRFLRRFYIEKGMFGSLSLTFIFYRPPLPGYGQKIRNTATSTRMAPDRKNYNEKFEKSRNCQTFLVLLVGLNGLILEFLNPINF